MPWLRRRAIAMSVADKVRLFLIENLELELPPEELTDDLSLLARVDSLGLFELVSFIEDEFGVTISNTELIPQNFDSLGGVIRLVESKLALTA
jgi:acyl carrier protein